MRALCVRIVRYDPAGKTRVKFPVDNAYDEMARTEYCVAAPRNALCKSAKVNAKLAKLLQIQHAHRPTTVSYCALSTRF